MRLKQAPSSEIPIRENRLKFIPWVGINLDDKDLHPIYISVPKPPPDESIDGYGLPPEEQYFRRKEWPVKLTNLYKNVTDELKRESDNSVNRRMTEWKIHLRFWEYLEKERENYEEEIKFIKHMWWWRTYGYWFWNDGEITFVPPDYFDFLNCWVMGDGDASVNDAYPEYRDKDRCKYTYKWYLENTDETFAEYDEENIPVKRHGEYEMENIGDKIFFGMAAPKTRRSGDTHQGLHKGLKIAMTGSHKFCTIVSLDGDNAETHYKKKLRPGWWAYPFFLKPISPSPRNSMSISFGLPEGVYGIEALESTFTFTKSAGEKKNDGDKINGLVSDEEGKSDSIDIHERWSVNRLAMATGGGTRIWGWSDHPSTVEDMTKGGANYQALCTQSDFYNRDPSKGQTISGLGLVFFPNYIGLEGFIDRFGKSVVDTPTERQIRLRPDAKFAKLQKGARQVLQDELDNLLRIGTPEAMKSYRSLRRKQPMCYADCWRGDGADSGFDMEKIELALAEHRRLVSVRQEPIIRGYFRRNEVGKVEWITDPAGRFEMAKKIPKELVGLKKQVPIYDPVAGGTVMHWAPMNGGKFIACGDTYAFDPQNVAKARKNKSNQSDGGFAIFWDKDSLVDQGDEISKWESYRFVLSYRARPKSLEDFQEDCLLACEYFGAYMYPETNRENLVEYFYRKGYAGYLLWDIDSVTGKRKNKPGFFSLEASKNDIFSAIKDYIYYRSHKEYFASFLTECRDIGSVDNMRHFDRFAAHGGCLIGLRALRIMAPAEGGTGVNLGGLSMFKKRTY